MDTPQKVAARWVTAIENMEKHRSQAYCMRYENLVGEPTKEMKALGKWLGVEADGFSTQEVRDSSIGKYRTGLSPEEVEQVLEIAGPTMETLGYL